MHFWGPLHTILAAVPAMRRQRRRADRQHLVDRRQDRRAAPGARTARASSRSTGLVGLDARRAREGRHLRHDRLPRADAHRLAVQRLVQGTAPRRVHMVRDLRFAAAGDDRRDARRRDRSIDACRYGDAELVITWPAKLAVIANAVVPEAVALGMMDIANRLLPAPTDEAGDRARSGWQSQSEWAPSKLTTLTDRAAAENNELPRQIAGIGLAAESDRRDPRGSDSEIPSRNSVHASPCGFSTTLMHSSFLSRKILIRLRRIVERQAVRDDERRIDFAALDPRRAAASCTASRGSGPS